MSQKKLDALKYIFLFLLLQFYIIGFFLRENVAGGAEKDFLNYTWPIIDAFKNQFYDTLKKDEWTYDYISYDCSESTYKGVIGYVITDSISYITHHPIEKEIDIKE